MLLKNIKLNVYVNSGYSAAEFSMYLFTSSNYVTNFAPSRTSCFPLGFSCSPDISTIYLTVIIACHRLKLTIVFNILIN